ncbi:L-lactate dehydrogenase (cytochrome) [Phyllobacterium sp. 1468]|uniref:alpha-hydroxy acid oxidase n=1 Tax=Phyllobacterium sp. 1468 TaxID=2817759 RepID=UPI001AE4968C|nr:alpha-hydroxy acid oxidase [Phyllobacterium sp. 1468]MDR6631331.1 L-lactate dehydrogenase (cytochrome) [Phyllobacterium sp. 1468]
MIKTVEIADLKEIARRRVPKMFFDYADSGAWTESTYRANEEDFGKIQLRQRVAVDMTDRTLESTMVGQKVSMPVALAPTGLTGMQHANGEMLAAQAAEEFGVPFTLSTMSICSIEDVASVTTKPFWFQLYVMRDRDFIYNLIDRAKAAKCSALVLTLDLQILGQRHKDLRNGLSAPPKFTPKHIWQMATRPQWCMEMLRTKRRTFGNIVGHAKGVGDLSSLSVWTTEQFDPRLSWSDVTWIKERWGGKLIIKGILDVEDAKMAAATGADAIIVSNHGGRQLDGAPSSISVLADIVDAVGDKIEVHFDGGIRSGQDVLKALAIGAKGTYIGRAFLYGLGAGGKKGVTEALEIIRKELDITMALCGERDVTVLDRNNLYKSGLETKPRMAEVKKKRARTASA